MNQSDVQIQDTFEKTIDEMPLNERPIGKISCDYVEGKMTTEKRNEKIRDLELLEDNERKILGNAKCLSEGVDVPTLDGIAFISPKSSQVDIIQAVGRAIRKSDDKSKGTIVVPLYISEKESLDEAILLTNFQKVWQIVTALKSEGKRAVDKGTAHTPHSCGS